jgi:glycosyltransferase involved in cell wall biosynthesis
LAFTGKRILIIVENLPVPFDKRVWNEARALSRAGYKVSIISPAGDGYEKRFEELEGIAVYRHPLPVEGTGMFSYLFEYSFALVCEFWLAMRIALTDGFDVIHACNPPDTIFLVGGFFKLFGKKFVFDHHDINPELYIAKFGRRGPLYHLMLFLERCTFRIADISIATNNSYRKIAIDRGSMQPKDVFVVRSGPDLTRFKPFPPQQELKEGKKYMVGYVGVMGKQEGLKHLIDAAGIIIREHRRSDILFVIIGSGTEFEDIKSYAAKRQVMQYFRFTDRVPDELLLTYLSTSDVCVNPDVANEMNDKSTMNKVMEYMALGKPIVQFDLTEGRESARESSLYANRNDARDFAEKIERLLDDPGLRAQMGEFGRRRIENELAWEYSERALLQAYASLFPLVSSSLRIGAFGFRSLPPQSGSAGADKFAIELYPRLVEHGHSFVAYNRVYKRDASPPTTYRGIRLVNLRTISKSGFDTLWHSFKATIHIILYNTADIIHIHNGGNSIWALPLRAFGKKVFVSQDGIDWRRRKWPWYGKAWLYLSTYITAHVPNRVIFDNIYSRSVFEKKFKKRFDYIPYGSEVSHPDGTKQVLEKYGLKPKEYFLFVGRFIPDKGLHYLIPAFECVETNKNLVMVGGAPHASAYERSIKSTKDKRILFPGFIYGDDTTVLMANAYAYIQPSDVEGLSPVILTIMGLGTPLICSDIQENLFAVADTALTFRQASTESLRSALEYALTDPDEMARLAAKAADRAKENFNWSRVVEQHLELFRSPQ